MVAPKFHFWKEFGAGKKRRIPFYKHWWDQYRKNVARDKVADFTIPVSQLPPGARVLDAEDFMNGHISAMPDELIKSKGEKVLYDHPWPYDATLDPIKNQKPIHCYTISTRFFTPRLDCLALTNTLLETDQLKAKPPIEITEEQLDTARRLHDWSMKGDGVLTRLPRIVEWPRVNYKFPKRYGISDERKEVNIMCSLFDLTQVLLSQHYSQQKDIEKLDELLQRRSVAYPHCQVPYQRQDRVLNLDLCVDSMSISDQPLPLIDCEPHLTKERDPINIHPRTWKSLVEQSRQYSPAWSFTMPRNSYPHTIQLAARIARKHRDSDEMLARSMVHAFGLTSQYARLRAYEKRLAVDTDESKQASVILQDPLSICEVNDKDLLDQPIVVQTIGFELPLENFHFMRYQLNTVNFDDSNGTRIKNQAWYSGPIKDLGEALRYYLDFQNSASQTELKLINKVAA